LVQEKDVGPTCRAAHAVQQARHSTSRRARQVPARRDERDTSVTASAIGATSETGSSRKARQAQHAN